MAGRRCHKSYMSSISQFFYWRLSQILLCCLMILQFYTNNLCEINTVRLMPVGFSEYIFYRLFSGGPDSVSLEVSWKFTPFVPQTYSMLA